MLCDELATYEGRDFEREVLLYLRLVYPRALQARPLGSVDRDGVDIVFSVEDGSAVLGVQCKGFKVNESEIGSSQVDQAIKSIEKYANSNFQVDEYWLVHNRLGSSFLFRSAVTEALQQLTATGRAKAVRLLPRDSFLAEIFDRMLAPFGTHLMKRSRRFRENLHLIEEPKEEIARVPYERSFGKVTPTSLLEDGHGKRLIDDPLKELREGGLLRSGVMGLILGEFGMGKTTLALRASVADEQNVLYVPAASFPPKASNSSHLSILFTGASDFFVEHSSIASDFLADEKLQRILLLLTDKTLSQNYSEFTLVVDGLDESPLLTSSNGLPLLFDALAGVKIRTILTMRSEYWATNKDALLTGYQARTPSNVRSSKNKNFSIIRLIKWGDPEVLLLISRVIETERQEHTKLNLQELRRIIQDGHMEQYYGDIPRRPLFLRMLIDEVKEKGVCHLTLVELFEGWIDQKIFRDIASPLRIGNVPREGISPSLYKPDLIRLYSKKCMMRAAEIMARIEGTELILYPNCGYDEVARHELKGYEDMTGLVLNSLLLPDQNDGDQGTLRFAHRAFQEFFTAKVILQKPLPAEVVLPAEVAAWIKRLDGKSDVA